MRRGFSLLLLFCLFAAGFSGVAEAGQQYRIGAPNHMRKRQPKRGYKPSYLEIRNDDDRGYAIDTDYRRNYLTFVHRSSGDIYLPANSSITLVFDDDDNWFLFGDQDTLEIEIRSGRTTRLRLETRRSGRNQVGLFATVDNGRQKYSKQLFKYRDRQPVVVIQPTPQPVVVHPGRPKPPVVVHTPPQPVYHTPPPPPAPIRPPYSHGYDQPSTGAAVGAVVGGIVGGLIDKDKDKNHYRR